MPQIQRVETYLSRLIGEYLGAMRDVRPWTEGEVYSVMGLQFRATRVGFLDISWSPQGPSFNVYRVTIGPWEKPRMWWCPVERLHMCQLGLVRGKGTTREWAYQQLKGKLNEHKV